MISFATTIFTGAPRLATGAARLCRLSLKVSDEFTVPLCAIHHNQIHTTLKEKEWWQERNIDPLKVAGELWQTSHECLLVRMLLGSIRLCWFFLDWLYHHVQSRRHKAPSRFYIVIRF